MAYNPFLSKPKTPKFSKATFVISRPGPNVEMRGPWFLAADPEAIDYLASLKILHLVRDMKGSYEPLNADAVKLLKSGNQLLETFDYPAPVEITQHMGDKAEFRIIIEEGILNANQETSL